MIHKSCSLYSVCVHKCVLVHACVCVLILISFVVVVEYDRQRSPRRVHSKKSKRLITRLCTVCVYIRMCTCVCFVSVDVILQIK